MFSRKTIFYLAAASALILFAIKNLDAVVDAYSRNRSLSIGSSFNAKKSSTPFARSIAHYTMGIIYDNDQKTKEAIKEYEAVIALDPGVSCVHTRLAADCFVLKNTDRAFEELKIAKNLDPADVKPHFIAALIYTSLNRLEDAREEYRQMTRLAPDSVWVPSFFGNLYIELANLYIIEKKPEEAAAILESAGKLGSNDVDFLLALGYSFTLIDDKIRALEFYNKALKADPKDPRVYFYLGVYYEDMKKRPLAVKNFREAIKLGPDFAEAYNYLGYILANDGLQLDQALELTNKAVSLAPDNGAFLDSLGWVQFKKGMTDEALAKIAKARDMDPDDPEIRDHLGDIYFKKGLKDKAREEWKKSLEFDPDQERVKEKLKK